jgi:glucose/arabinose dehydrogenase
VLLAACSGTPPAAGPASTVIRPPTAATTPAPPVATSEPATTSVFAPGGGAGTAAESVPAPTTAPATALAVSTVVSGLPVPWGIGFLPDGRALIAGRDDASIRLIAADDAEVAAATPVGYVDGVEADGEGGLLGLAVSPTFADDALVFVYYTAESDNRIATMTLRDGALTDQQVIANGIPKAGIHNGGRLAFGPDGLLYVGTGDAGERSASQDLGSLGGKILRLSPDGTPAPGNPFPQAPAVYSLGHRNVQGLAFDEQGRLWAAEFGQNTYDELNLIVAGSNYGWPEVEGPDSDGSDGFAAPERVWSTDDASPSGIAVWQGSVWMAGLRGERLWQIPLTGAAADGATGEPIAHLTNVYGRLRTVLAAPDGGLWVSTSNTDGRGDVRDGDDRLLRLQYTA